MAAAPLAAGVDYGAFGQISVADGASTGSLTVSVTDDGDLETLVEDRRGDDQQTRATADRHHRDGPRPRPIITDNETATADLSVTTQGDENGPTDIEFTVTLDKVNDTGGPITFELADLGTGTATAGSDYGALPSTITVADGASTGTAMVSVTDDALLEGAETVEAQIINPSDPRVSIGTGTATATITDNDDAAVTIGDVTVNEETGFATVALTLDKAVEGGFTVPVNFAPGATDGATANVDFNATSRTAVFAGAAGEVQSITIPIADDAIVEADETIAVSLGAASQGLVNTGDTATATITNTDTTTVSVLEHAVSEGAGDLTVTLSVDNPVSDPFSVDVTALTGGGSATDGVDFTGATRTANFAGGIDGETVTVTFTGLIGDDADVEGDETFELQLSNPQIAGSPTGDIILGANAEVTIVDDEAAPSGEFGYVVDEGSDALFRIDLATGDLTLVSDNGTGVGPNFIGPRSVILNGAGDTAYVVDSSLDALISVDLATGNRVVVSDSGTGVGPNFSNPLSLILNGAGDTAYVVDSILDALISVDLATGEPSGGE